MADPIVFYQGFLGFTTSTGGTVYTAPAGLKSVTIPVSRAQLDDAVMGDDIDATYPGIQSAPITAKFRNNYNSTGIDALAFSRWNSKTMFKVKVRPTTAAVSSTNPSLRWTRMYIASITPIQGAHGELLFNDIELKPATGCTFSRSTST